MRMAGGVTATDSVTVTGSATAKDTVVFPRFGGFPRVKT